MKAVRSYHTHITTIAMLVAVGIGLIACDQGGEQEVSTGSTTATPEPAEPVVKRASWVLRDKDGVALPVLVEPSCGEVRKPYGENWPEPATRTRCRPPALGGQGETFPCVRVIALDDKYVNFMYELATGTVGVCNSVRTWVSEVFNNAECKEDEEPYTTVSSQYGDDDRLDRWPRHLYWMQDQWMYIDGTDCLYGESLWFRSQGECRELGGQELSYCRVKPIPDWALNMLGNPPYTLKLEY